MRIGFIGLGAMGTPMAAQLVTAGHQVHGFDMRLAPVPHWRRMAVTSPPRPVRLPPMPTCCG